MERRGKGNSAPVRSLNVFCDERHLQSGNGLHAQIFYDCQVAVPPTKQDEPLHTMRKGELGSEAVFAWHNVRLRYHCAEVLDCWG